MVGEPRQRLGLRSQSSTIGCRDLREGHEDDRQAVFSLIQPPQARDATVDRKHRIEQPVTGGQPWNEFSNEGSR
ncbi:hypothetical protein SULPSESMR1_00470 [Pseudosulfitobacter pseudonitzschiae]|uniref:Uncharacterized protein n=1 Tax=Pseudosulfitobacter pseudonitzschiae TaxID=1402135 RepID=A0A221JX54_9RHOB|nr:hypothetical protein SULPSESMR1_00470 [Pseudosulfitobacter pseudonitzschiae]